MRQKIFIFYLAHRSLLLDGVLFGRLALLKLGGANEFLRVVELFCVHRVDVLNLIVDFQLLLLERLELRVLRVEILA